MMVRLIGQLQTYEISFSPSLSRAPPQVPAEPGLTHAQRRQTHQAHVKISTGVLAEGAGPRPATRRASHSADEPRRTSGPQRADTSEATN